MRLLFSEAPAEPSRYLYPYVVWGFLEPRETPADAFNAGFLPGNPELERFYLTRHVRVPLQKWQASSENRRILRRGETLTERLVPREEFELTPERRSAWLAYAAERFGPGVMPPERLDRILHGRLITHVLEFRDANTDEEAGTVLLHLEAPRAAFYPYAFYQFTPETRHLGLVLMTRTVAWCARAGFGHLYLGTCYTEAALYKTAFRGLEFFNGFRWSTSLDELKHLIRTTPSAAHRLESPEFVELQPGSLVELAAASGFLRG